jgi:hypothetical protein
MMPLHTGSAGAIARLTVKSEIRAGFSWTFARVAHAMRTRASALPASGVFLQTSVELLGKAAQS